MSSAYLNTPYANLDELSPSDNSEENSFDVNYLPPSYGVSVESGYYADYEFVPASSEQFPELEPDVYSDSYLGHDGSQVVPVYYPIPSYYQLYNGVSAVENNGTTYYSYYEFAVPMYSISPNSSTGNLLTSDATSVSHPDDFSNEIFENLNADSYFDHIIPSSDIADDLTDLPGDSIPEEFIDDFTASYDEASSSEQFTPSTISATDVTSDTPVQEFVDDFTTYYDEAIDSSILIPENDFTAEERKNDIKRKKDWPYLLSLSGKLHVKDHIPQVHVMPEVLEEEEDVEITEDDEDVEISEEILELGDSLEKELWTDVIPEIDKSDGDQKNPKKDVIESSYADGAHEDKCLAIGEENDVWNDFFYSIDDPVFGIEACFSNTSEKELINESFHNDLDKNNVNVLSTCRKTFMILPRLNKQIQILPTIVEEDESVVNSEISDVIVAKTPVEVNKENTMGMEKECFESKQQNAEKVENSCGLAETTVEVGTSEKPKKKKRFKGIRRFFSELRSCFRKRKDSPG